MKNPFRFDCVFYYVTDLDRAIAFYTDVLGFQLSSRDAVARLAIDGVRLELVPTREPSRLSGTGNARLALNVDDIADATAHLAARGVAVSPTRRVENGWLASFTDLDGNEIFLWQDT